MAHRSVAQSGIIGEERMTVTYRGKSVVLIPSERVTKGVLTFDMCDAENSERIYTFLYRGSRGGFSGNRLARLRNEAEVGWLSRGNHLHPQDTPQKAALHYLKWSYRRSKAGRKTTGFRGVAGRGAA